MPLKKKSERKENKTFYKMDIHFVKGFFVFNRPLGIVCGNLLGRDQLFV